MMNILAVDDEQLALEHMTDMLAQVFPKGVIYGEMTGKCAMEYTTRLKEEGDVLHYIFLDIQLKEMNGIDLGKQMKRLFPNAKILFCTAYTEYACESYQMNAYKGNYLECYSWGEFTNGEYYGKYISN